MKKNKAIQDLISYAQGNLSSANLLSSHQGASHDIIFLCHECIEKYLKALIQFQGKEFPYTHKLESLIKVLELDSRDSVRLVNIAIILDELYPIARYPGKEKATFRDAKTALLAAKEGKEIVMKYLDKES